MKTAIIVFTSVLPVAFVVLIVSATHAVSLAYDPQLYFSTMDNFINKYIT